MAEENKRRRTLVKVGEQSDERYDNFGHKIEKETIVKETPRAKELEKPKVSERPKTPDKPKKEDKPKEEKLPKKKLYTSVPREELPSHEKRIRERAPKRRKTIYNIIKIALVLLLIAGIVCLFVFSIGGDENDIEKAFLTTGTIENIYNANVNIIKNEYSISAGFSGRLLAIVNDGDRVAAGTAIAYVVKPEYEQEIIKLRQVEDKITAAQSVSSYIESQHTEFGQLNEQIALLTTQLSEMSASSSKLSQYNSIMQELSILFETKHEIVMNAEVSDEYINGLKKERAEIENNLKNYMERIYTPHAGVISFYADNQSSATAEKAAQISEYLKRKGEAGNVLSETALQHAASEMLYTIGSEVAQGQVVARVTPDVNCYMSADVSALDYSVFTPGKEITVRAKDRSLVVNASVKELLSFGEKTYVLFESSTGMTGSVSKRVVDSEMVIDYSEGLRVPKRALTEWDSARLTARISILRSNYVSYVYVNVLAENGEYAIISPSNEFVTKEDEGITSVRVNDIYIVNYEKVTEGQIIGG